MSRLEVATIAMRNCVVALLRKFPNVGAVARDMGTGIEDPLEAR